MQASMSCFGQSFFNEKQREIMEDWGPCARPNVTASELMLPILPTLPLPLPQWIHPISNCPESDGSRKKIL